MLKLPPPLYKPRAFIIFVACIISVNAVLGTVNAAANLFRLALVLPFLFLLLHIIAVLSVLVSNRLRG